MNGNEYHYHLHSASGSSTFAAKRFIDLFYSKKFMNRFFLASFFLIAAFPSALHSPTDKLHRNIADSFIGNTKGLKDYYRNYFPIGVAVAPGNLKTDEANLILEQFNSLTPENAMKMGPIHPEENRYFWNDADSIVAFAQAHGLRVRGHNLCWHNQTPRWLFRDSAGNNVSKEILLQRLKDHITTVVNRYKGKIYAWDVVNEAISDKADEYLRPSLWYQICGEDFITKAFVYAHAADPDAILFYNDYNEINPIKREKIYKLVKSLKDAGVPIGGVGLQGHWAINEPSREQLDSTIKKISDLGVKIQITELEISVYPKEHKQTRTLHSLQKKKKSKWKFIKIVLKFSENTGR
jgi:endo-1,4-beta-xylanase